MGRALLPVLLAAFAAVGFGQSQSDDGRKELVGLKRVALDCEFSPKEPTIAISCPEVLATVTPVLRELGISVVERQLGEMLMIIHVGLGPPKCQPRKTFPDSDLVLDGRCIGGPSAGIELRRLADDKWKGVWGRGMGAGTYPDPFPPEEQLATFRKYLDKMVQSFADAYREANRKN